MSGEHEFDRSLLESRSKRFPNMKKPEIVGHFSLDQNREYQSNASNLQYYYGQMPHYTIETNLNLDAGVNEAITKPKLLQETEKINHILEYLRRNMIKHLDTEANRLFNCDFICYRGAFTKILGSPYERNDGWSFGATYYHGNIYLCEFVTEARRSSELNAGDRQNRCSSWGYKFEQYILTDDPKKKPDTTKPVNEFEEFSCVFETKLDNIKLLYGAEMDGVLRNERFPQNADPEFLNSEFNKLKFIELKTSQTVENDRQYANLLRFKYKKWWFQCFMAGINDLVVGYRNYDGNVLELSHLLVKDLAKHGQKYWSANVCAGFLVEFLKFVKSTIINDPNLVENDAQTVWKFDWSPPRLKIVYQKITGPSQHSFIPDWYTRDIETNKPKNNL